MRAIRAFSIFSLCLAAQLCCSLPGFAQLSGEDAQARSIQLYNESVTLINQGQLDPAQSKLSEALRLDPNNANILNNYGLVMLKLGNPQESRRALERAQLINPKFDAISLNLGLACEQLGDLAAARVALLRYIEITPNRNQAEKMKDHVAIIDKTLAAGGGSTGVVSSDDYLGQLQASQLHPWPKNRMPLKIFIAPAEGVEGYKESYGFDFERAVERWTAALEGKVTFQKVLNENGADIAVRWTHDTKNALLKAEGGDCRYSANGEGMNHCEITMLTVDPSKTDKLNDAKVSWVALHELGHALGINAHSNAPGDIMYFSAPQTNTMPDLSQRDIRTFNRLYSEKLPDTWLSLNGEAIKLIRDNKFDEALEKLNAALKMAPDQKVLKENMVLVEAKLATALLEQSKYDEAEKHLIKALELEQEVKDQNYPVILNNYAEMLRRAGRASEIDAMQKKYGPRK